MYRLRFSLVLLAASMLCACPRPPTTTPLCGNGATEEGEQCDDGNTASGDGCEADCTLPVASVCGNGKVEGTEQCDDGNQVAGDGCENDCTPTPAPVCGNGKVEGSEACDDGNQVAGDGCENDCTVTGGAVCGNGKVEGSEACDDGNKVAGDGCENDCTLSAVVQTCPKANLPPPASGTCEVTAGDGNRLLTGIVLAPDAVLLGGQVLYDTNGAITCVACDCSTAAGAATATQVTCPKGVISPGLINSHDHITFQAAPFVSTTTERYEHRHDWRVGNDGHTSISSGGTATNAMIKWGELRQVMAGTTSVSGSGGVAGLLRNLDKPNTATGASQENLGGGANGARYETFPLNDSSGTERTSGCAYTGMDTPAVIPADSAYLPHISEGIEESAHNEFVCLSQPTASLVTSHTAMIHGIGLRAADIALVANQKASLIWSPRSNVYLYGDTARVTIYARQGVNIALGTDWVRSGSMNVLRELRCADLLNQNAFQSYFTDRQLWKMVTENAAKANWVATRTGTLAQGKVADIAIFRQQGTETYRSVLSANPEDVVLVVRGGRAMYGDTPIVGALESVACDSLDVCGTSKAVCLARETGDTLAALTTANASTYPLFACNAAPADEPACTMVRAAGNSHNGSTEYSGQAATGDRDGDGIADGQDVCPDVFSPIRPMDNGKQPDADSDGVGDACDVCPFNTGTTCKPIDPNDVDGDGVPNATDNCPNDANAGQTDTDNDQVGDACDFCPASNPNSGPCPVTIYDLKSPSSALVGHQVTLSNVLVTGVTASGFFLQVHEVEGGYKGADYSGIYVYKPTPGVAVGDRVNITTATLTNYFGQMELTSPTITAGSTGNAMPAPTDVPAADIADTGTRAAALEAVLVRVSNVTVTDLAPAPGPGQTPPTNEFAVTGGLRVNGLFYVVSPFPALGETFSSITGIAELRNGHYKIEPRSAQDYVYGAATVVALGPSPTYTRVGTTGPAFPTPLVVTLSRTQSTDTHVTVTSSSTDLTVANGGDVVVLAGNTTAGVDLTGVVANAAVTLTATLGTSSKTATVRVLGASEPVKLVAIEPATATLSPGGTVALTVRLDLPAPAVTTIALAVNPGSGFGTLPAATVDVPANQQSATVTFTGDMAATGSGTVTATLGADTVSSTLTVQSGANHVVISELAVAGPGGAGDEFVELYNPTSSAVSLSGWKIQYKSATGAAYSTAATLPSNASIAPHGYYLATGLGYQGATTGDFVSTTAFSFSGTVGHVRLGKANVGTGKTDANAVDTVGYGTTADSPEGGAAAPVPTSPATLERKAYAASTVTTMSAGGADVTAGNGWDSDNNQADFVVRAARDPQSSAGPTEP